MCPACGLSSIVQRPFHIKDECPTCGVSFKREEGFFVGAISINVMATEFIILVIYLISLLIFNTNFQHVLTAMLIMSLIFPVAFYHHSWSIWLSFDHLVESLPKHVKQRWTKF